MALNFDRSLPELNDQEYHQDAFGQFQGHFQPGQNTENQLF